MTREEKTALVKEFRDRFEKAEAAFLADYRGIDVEGMTKLRSSLRDSSSEFKIVKNTLAKLAVKGTTAEPLSEHFKDTTAIAFSYKDSALTAKVLMEFAKDQPALEIKIGTIGDRVVEAGEIKTLASLPSRDELLASMLGALKNIPAGFARVLNGVPQKLVYALSAVAREKEAGG